MVRKIPRLCIDCGKDISERGKVAVRCIVCQQRYKKAYKKKLAKNGKKRKERHCGNCGKDITHLPNRATWCKECRKPYLRDYINRWKREHRIKKTPQMRGCAKCGKDISDRHYLAVICLDCRELNKKRADRDFYLENKKEHNARCMDYYQKNREGILAYYKKQRRWRRYRDSTKDVVVAVSCVFCDEIIIGNAGKKICSSCKQKWERTVPNYIELAINSLNSFAQIPEELRAWKRIIDVRHEGIYQISLIEE